MLIFGLGWWLLLAACLLVFVVNVACLCDWFVAVVLLVRGFADSGLVVVTVVAWWICVVLIA